jgi:hypothetical protein
LWSHPEPIGDCLVSVSAHVRWTTFLPYRARLDSRFHSLRGPGTSNPFWHGVSAIG